MSDFTPRPWRIGAIESGMVAIDGANGEEVTGFVSPEDGRLIAAAPELLEALQELCEIVEDAIEQKSAKDLDSFTLQPARAAIAKATGEQP